MNKTFYCKKNKAIIFKKPNAKSEHLKEILLGEKFIKLKKYKNFYYGYCKFDNYLGYVKKDDLIAKQLKPNYIIKTGKAYFYKTNKLSSKTKKFLYFNSQINISKPGKIFSKTNNKWIKNSDLKSLKKDKKNNFIENFKIFQNSKYKWGGNTVDGIDCSGLVQELMKNKYRKCPRDSKDQENYFKKKIDIKNIKKGDLLFWKGHVAIALNKIYCVHAFGPARKVTKMKINDIISILLKKSLKLRSIKRPLL